MCFTNKVVVITGAASGMGAAIALSFSKLNAAVCIIDINEKELLKVKQTCENLSQCKVLSVVSDLCKEEDIDNAVRSTLKEHGRIDVLINAAGVLGAGSLQDSDIIEKFDKVIPINLRSVVAMTKKALPALIESHGCVVNISSIATAMMLENSLVYSISKAGVTRFTKAAAFELAKHGVRVNCISPGPVKTNIMINAGYSEADNEKHWDTLARISPLGDCTKVEHIAEMVVYLASDRAAAITGTDVVIDAGMLLGFVGDNPRLPVATRSNL